MNHKIEFVLIVLLYLVCLYIWMLPINQYPFGDVDSSTHFALADYMGQTDKPISDLPPYIAQQYAFANNGKLWYPPQYHTNLAITQLFTNSRFVSVYLMNAILCSIVVLTSFLLIRSLYGFWPAYLSSFLLIFSSRDYLYYTLGLWPQTASFAILPAILYCYYKYTDFYLKKEEKPIYLYIMTILLLLQYFFHAHPLIHSLAAIAIYTAFLIIKNKKLPFNTKHVGIALVIFLVLALPFAQFLFTKASEGTGTFEIGNLGRLFKWYPSIEQYAGAYPASFFSYSASHGIWTLPLLFIGLIFILIRRKNNDLFMIGWFISYYLMIHLDIIGQGGRIPRSLGAEAQLFYPIIAIGLIGITSFLKIKQTYKQYLKYGLIACFIILTLIFNAMPAYNALKHAYEGTARINQYQLETTNWIKENIPQDTQFYMAGVQPLAKRKWVKILSYRPALWTGGITPPENPEGLNESQYLLIDYSDWVIMNQQQVVYALQQWELSKVKNPIFTSKNKYVKVFKLENK